jgi:hypothetical protein
MNTLRNFLFAYDSMHLKRPEIDFNPVVTQYKIYIANVLLTLLSILKPEEIKFFDNCGHRDDSLKVQFNNRQFFTRINGAVRWKMVGFEDCLPNLIFKKKDVYFALHVDKRIFVDAGLQKEYLPSAAIIITNYSVSCRQFSRVPFSWGADIVPINFHLPSTLFLECILGSLPKKHRNNFVGFKYVKSKFKYIVSNQRIYKKEKTFFQNTGFKVKESIDSTDKLEKYLLKILSHYFAEQKLLVNRLSKARSV